MSFSRVALESRRCRTIILAVRPPLAAHSHREVTPFPLLTERAPSADGLYPLENGRWTLKAQPARLPYPCLQTLSAIEAIGRMLPTPCARRIAPRLCGAWKIAGELHVSAVAIGCIR